MTDSVTDKTAVYNENITFLGEDDFAAAMAIDCAAWIKDTVRDDFFDAGDNVRIHYYTAIPESPNGAVVIVHGFCEFFGKYHETAWYFYRAGYAVFFCEHRGHGHSGGKQPEPNADVVYIDDYDTYINDFRTFMDRIVRPAAKDLDLIIYAHSMGGAIGALFLEEYPGYFKAAVFSSPMFNIRGADFPAFSLPFLDKLFKVTGMSKKLPPSQHHFSGVYSYEKSLFDSKARYDYFYDMCMADPDYRTSGASYGWVMASLKAINRLLASAGRIKIPVTLLYSGKDILVGPSGYDVFKSRVPHTVLKFFPESKHEVFNAGTPDRQRFFREVLDTIKSMTMEG